MGSWYFVLCMGSDSQVIYILQAMVNGQFARSFIEDESGAVLLSQIKGAVDSNDQGGKAGDNGAVKPKEGNECRYLGDAVGGRK